MRFIRFKVPQKGQVGTFGGRMIWLFILLLTVTAISQFFYKSSIDRMHQALLSAVNTAVIIHTAENFHSAAHSMLLISVNDATTRDSAVSQKEYRDQKRIAYEMLNDLSTPIAEDHNENHDVADSQVIIKDISLRFSEFSAETDALMDTKMRSISGNEETTRRHFDVIFSTYLALLHQYHDTRLDDLKKEAHVISQTSTVIFVTQLTIVMITVILAGIFSFHAIFRPYRKAERHALFDALTGLRNRRYFDDFMIPEMSDLARKGITFSISMMDIDKFKTFNDTYGHQIGDEILKKLAIVVKAGVRETDSVVRYGGEEFFFLFPGTKKESALIVVENMRKAIESYIFSSTNLEHGVSVSASFGIASFPNDGKEIPELIKKADEKLYQAKFKGRNQVSI